MCLDHWREMTALPEKSVYPAIDPPLTVRREAVEENTGEKFIFEEKLHAHAAEHPDHTELNARMDSDELAFRMQMQMQVPETRDLSQESEKTKAQYGIGKDTTDAFGRKCLLARKLVGKGVRFVQLYRGSWDSHDCIERAHGNLVAGVDQPIAALIADLKKRGLLESSLVVWCGEFGRTPATASAAA
jgi:uncharacterized protein (DUF1501 family)